MSHKVVAVVFGAVCHAAFIGAVGVMFFMLHGAMDLGTVRLNGGWAFLFDLFLLLQFPVVHSICLGAGGRKFLIKLFPAELGKRLITTTFVTLASAQLLLLFGLWSHLGEWEWSPTGALLVAWQSVYVLSWILLGVAMVNAGLGIQMGYKGWLSVVRDREPEYGPFPQGGLYKVCRHPVYFSMALVACTGPVWNLDHVILCLVFVAYCIVGPMIKDRRFVKMYGGAFLDFKERIPFFPTPVACLRVWRQAAFVDVKK